MNDQNKKWNELLADNEVFLKDYCSENTKRVLKIHKILSPGGDILIPDFITNFREIVKRLTVLLPNAAHSSPGWTQLPLLVVGECDSAWKIKPRYIGLCIIGNGSDARIYPFLDSEGIKNGSYPQVKEEDFEPWLTGTALPEHYARLKTEGLASLKTEGLKGLEKLEGYLNSQNKGSDNDSGIAITPNYIEEQKMIKGISDDEVTRTLVTDKDEIINCQAELEAVLKKLLNQTKEVTFGFPGGNFSETVNYNDDIDIWYATFSHDNAKIPRFWNGFGLHEKSNENKSNYNISVETNIPKALSRKVMGAFVTNEDGKIELIHRGRLNPGGSKFLKWYREKFGENVETISTGEKVIVIGAISDDEFISNYSAPHQNQRASTKRRS